MHVNILNQAIQQTFLMALPKENIFYDLSKILKFVHVVQSILQLNILLIFSAKNRECFGDVTEMM